MAWLNPFGLMFMGTAMVPNVIFALRCRGGFDHRWRNRPVEALEQVGRFGCLGFMVVNLPGIWFGWWSDEAFAVYLMVDSLLVLLYCAVWVVCWKKPGRFRSLALSVLPSCLFLFSGIMSRSVPLIVSALLFGPAHILLSFKNAT